MKYTSWILIAALFSIVGCKPVDNDLGGGMPNGFSAKRTSSDGQFFLIEEPMLENEPVLAKNAKATGRFICEVLGRKFDGKREAIQFRVLNEPVWGLFMGVDQFGRATGLEREKQDTVIDEMYCLE